MRYFIAVAEELHFTRAAARLHIAQPPLSQQIRLLETELRTILLHRTSRHVELTPAGHAFLEEARKAVRQAARAAEVAQLVGQEVAGNLELAFVDSALHGYLPQVLRAHRRQHPAVHIFPRELASGQQIDALQRGDVQVGLLRWTRPGPQLKLEEIGRERLMVALPSDHSLRLRREIQVEELKGLPFVFPERSVAPGLYDHLVGLLGASGVVPRIVEEAREGHTIVGLVAAGLGVSIIPETLARWSARTVAFRPVADASALLGMYLGWRRHDRSPIVRAFLEVVRDVRRRGLLPHYDPASSSPRLHGLPGARRS